MPNTPPIVNRPGEDLFLRELGTIERVIAFVARRHALASDEREDFASHVKLKLVEGDFEILRKYEGRSALRTYLHTVIQRLFLDYRNHAWGKWRPSAEARRAGPTAILFERLTTRDGHSVEEAFELLTTNYQLNVTRSSLDALIARLPSRQRRRFESDTALANTESGSEADDEAIGNETRDVIGDRVSASLQRVMGTFSSEERLLIAMRFEDGRTVAEIAATCRLDQKALYRRLDRLLARIRTALEADGVSAAEVRELLEYAASLDWSWMSVEKSARGPSLPGGHLCL